MQPSQEPSIPITTPRVEADGRTLQSTQESANDLQRQQSESEFQPFDPRNISAERVSGLIFSGVVGVGMLVGLCTLFFSMGLGWVIYLCLAITTSLLLLLLWYTIFWPSIEHRHRSWRLSEVGLELRHGVWWKHMHAVPWARVQHADVTQGPLQRMYGVGTLTVHTAGTASSSVNLGGLSHQVAIDLRDEIIRQRTQGDVV